MYIEVAVAAPIAEPLTYALPEIVMVSGTSTFIGRRVLVPLGKRRVTGYVVGLSESDGKERHYTIKKIISFLDDTPIFHPEMLPFFRWIADYYLYPLGMVIKTALPGGLTVKSSKKLIWCGGEQNESAKEFSKVDWLQELIAEGELSVKKTTELLKQQKISRQIESLRRKKIIDYQLCNKRERIRKKEEICWALSRKGLQLFSENEIEATEDLRKKINNLRKKIKNCNSIVLGYAQTRALYTLFLVSTKEKYSQGSFKTLSEIPLRTLRKVYPSIGNELSSLSKKGLVLQSKRRIFRSPFDTIINLFNEDNSTENIECRFQRPEELSSQQQHVLNTIFPAIEKKKYHSFLLFGITGAGKTEVYLRAAEKTLREGRSVIVLVPEIALATQLEGQFVARFNKNGEELVVLQHSGLSEAEKYDQYTLALTGTAKIVIGARSAVFAPLVNPGLIIVDEEHDGSYKQDDNLRYNGRDLAVVRGLKQNCVVLLGSATPSITSFANAKKGKYTLLTMNKRIGKAMLPTTTLVDLTKKGALNKGSIISPLLAEKIATNLDKKHQTILLMNRRGFSSALLCTRCGTPVQCPHCNVSLTLHKHNYSLVCHYCGHYQDVGGVTKIICKECRSEELAPAGFGTERVEDEVAKRFPEAIVQRIDSDVANDRRLFHKLLSEMHNRKIDILIGTQMIAKGHHFPYVTLVGVIWADGGMSIPDYKAAEKSFQIITQVNGRAGRGDLPGEVVIQTLRPEHYSIQFACENNYLKFFNHESTLRQQPVFPPFTRLVLLRLQGKVEKKVETESARIAKFCREWLHKKSRTYEGDKRLELSVLGPVPSPLDKLKEKYRFQLLLKCADSALLHELCRTLLAKQRQVVRGDVDLVIDIDPENMM